MCIMCGFYDIMRNIFGLCLWLYGIFKSLILLHDSGIAMFKKVLICQQYTLKFLQLKWSDIWGLTLEKKKMGEIYVKQICQNIDKYWR